MLLEAGIATTLLVPLNRFDLLDACRLRGRCRIVPCLISQASFLAILVNFLALFKPSLCAQSLSLLQQEFVNKAIGLALEVSTPIFHFVCYVLNLIFQPTLFGVIGLGFSIGRGSF